MGQDNEQVGLPACAMSEGDIFILGGASQHGFTWAKK
jgi:hypothetical protein